jgi:nicotinamide riboside kinase
MLESVLRVVMLGRGASGKSTLAVQLATITRLPVIELDRIFWQPGLVATPRAQWEAIQQELVKREKWIIDGDLGPYDVVDIRLRAADTVVFLDFSLLRCACRAIRRSGERIDFWRWLLRYRRKSRPRLMEAIATHAARANFHILRNPDEVRRFVERLTNESLAGTESA